MSAFRDLQHPQHSGLLGFFSDSGQKGSTFSLESFRLFEDPKIAADIMAGACTGCGCTGGGGCIRVRAHIRVATCCVSIVLVPTFVLLYDASASERTQNPGPQSVMCPVLYQRGVF